MCTPIPGADPVSITFFAISQTLERAKQLSNLKNERSNAKYQMQTAYQNALNAKRQGQQTLQEGIENSRKEKIKGLQQANLEKAKAAASGFDSNSGTNLLNYQDTIDTANTNARITQENSAAQAGSYFKQANSYLDTARNIKHDYNEGLFGKAMSYLQSENSVAAQWYEGNKEEGKLYGFF